MLGYFRMSLPDKFGYGQCLMSRGDMTTKASVLTGPSSCMRHDLRGFLNCVLQAWAVDGECAGWFAKVLMASAQNTGTRMLRGSGHRAGRASLRKPGTFVLLVRCRRGEEGEEVAEVVGGELFVDALGHDRGFSGAKLFNVGGGEKRLLGGAVDDAELIGGVGAEDAREGAAVVERDGVGNVVGVDHGAGRDDVAKDRRAVAMCQVREIRPDLGAFAVNGVAVCALGGLAEKQFAAAAGVAAGELGVFFDFRFGRGHRFGRPGG